ncbi:MAG: aldo/keto reductase [Streptosporangiales bacterium]
MLRGVPASPRAGQDPTRRPVEVTIDQLTAAQQVTPIVSVQNRYNLTNRASEKVLGYCQRHGTAFIPWHPIGTIANRLGVTRSQVALAWLLHHSPVMLPIPGTSSPSHLEEDLAAADLTLDPDDLAQLDTN